MKKIISIAMLSLFCFTTIIVSAQMHSMDKSKRPSPPDSVMQMVNGKNVSINYSSPSLKGRVMGVSVEPKKDTVWRAGANEATVFMVDKDVTINGKALPAGKYALFVLVNDDNSWTFIFNKKWNVWGAFDYSKNKDQDALKVTVKPSTLSTSNEHLKYTIGADGTTSLIWGTTQASFKVN
jgi:hypothetical protein